MAYLYRKRGFWYVAYRTPDGWRRESMKTKKKGIAETRLPRFHDLERTEMPLTIARASLGEFVESYLEHRRQQISAVSLESPEKYRHGRRRMGSTMRRQSWCLMPVASRTGSGEGENGLTVYCQAS
jgi:hypothetical protein